MKSKLLNKKQGFTLIEIIIVVVILGILAAVALPKLVQNIGRSLAAEAFGVGSAYAKAVDRCVAERTGGGPVTNTESLACLTELNLVQYMSAPSVANFTYTYTNAVMVNTITATPTPATIARGMGAGDTIAFAVNTSNGAVTRTCGAGFALMCK